VRLKVAKFESPPVAADFSLRSVAIYSVSIQICHSRRPLAGIHCRFQVDSGLKIAGMTGIGVFPDRHYSGK